MELKEVMLGRRSVRGYTSQPVSKELLEEVLNLAKWSISAENTQSWEFVVVTGEKLDRIREINVTALREKHVPDRPFAAVPDGKYKDRSRTIGKALLGKMEIARDDKEGRQWWGERGFRLFDAPALIYVLMDQSLEETPYRFDIGCITQNICLAAYDLGLGTCVADQAIMYQAETRKLLNIPEDKRFVCGIAIGYPDTEFAANHVVREREEISNITSWHGFEA